MLLAMLYIEVAYKVPNVKTLARLCRTNLAASTAFRLLASDTGIITENILSCIAHQLNLNSVQVCYYFISFKKKWQMFISKYPLSALLMGYSSSKNYALPLFRINCFVCSLSILNVSIRSSRVLWLTSFEVNV